MACREQVAQLRPTIPALEAAGVRPIAIGCGSVMHLGWFLEELAPGLPAYTDPTTKVYEAAGLRKGVFETIRPLSAWNAAKRYLSGTKAAGIKGDVLQQGGTLLVRDGELLYRQVSRGVGDHPTAEQLLAEVKRRL